MPTSLNSQASSGWLGSERHFLAAVVFVGRCVLRGMQKASGKFFVFWQTQLKDFALTWARHGTGRCCASFPRSTGSASWIWPATTTPPWPPSLSPLSPGQRLSWAERALPARLRGGSLMWTDGTRGAGYICSLNSSTFAIVCKWVRALGGWETMGLGSKYSFPVMCSKVNLCCVIKFDTDEENTCWCKQLASLPAEAQTLCRTSANAFFSPVGKGPSEEACLGIPFHSFTASGCLFWDSAWI